MSIIGNLMRFVSGTPFSSPTEKFEHLGAIVFTILLGIVFFRFGTNLTKKKSSNKEIDDIGKY